MGFVFFIRFNLFSVPTSYKSCNVLPHHYNALPQQGRMSSVKLTLGLLQSGNSLYYPYANLMHPRYTVYSYALSGSGTCCKSNRFPGHTHSNVVHILPLGLQTPEPEEPTNVYYVLILPLITSSSYYLRTIVITSTTQHKHLLYLHTNRRFRFTVYNKLSRALVGAFV